MYDERERSDTGHGNMHEIAKCEDEAQLHAHATDCGRGRSSGK